MTVCEEQCALFIPICCSVDGLCGNEDESLFKRVSKSLSSKWEKSYSEVMDR